MRARFVTSVFVIILCTTLPALLVAQNTLHNPGRPSSSGDSADSLTATQRFLSESLLRAIDPHQPQKLKSLLIKPEVQRELQIDRATYLLVSKALSDLTRRTMELSQSLPKDAKDIEAMQEYSRKMIALSREREMVTEEVLNEVFPPDSLARLKQIAIQIQIKEAGLGNVLVHGVMADQLEFSKSQWDNVNRKADELQREKQEKMRAIAQEYDALLLSNLTPKQRRKYDELVGEPFSFVAVSSTRKSFDRVRKYRESQM